MSKSHLYMTAYRTLSISLFILCTLFLGKTVFAAPRQTPTFYSNICNDTASRSFSITEDRSFYITNPWIGGAVEADDQIGYSTTINGAAQIVGSWPASVGCGDTAASSSGGIGIFY